MIILYTRNKIVTGRIRRVQRQIVLVTRVQHHTHRGGASQIPAGCADGPLEGTDDDDDCDYGHDDDAAASRRWQCNHWGRHPAEHNCQHDPAAGHRRRIHRLYYR